MSALPSTSTTLVLGGASSGKSNIAEQLCMSYDLPRIYIATAQAFDDEMRAKIKQHQMERGTDWQTINAPIEVADALKSAPKDHVILLDCLTMWLSNLLLQDANIESATMDLLSALQACASPVVIVSNEVGQGIVPDNALARRFRIAQGRLNRQVAAQANCVIGVMAGLPFALKGTLPDALT